MDPTVLGIAAEAGTGVLGNILGFASAERQMAFQREMSGTAHQREVADLKKAGLNPLLSVNAGASAPQGAMFTPDNPLRGMSANVIQRGLVNEQIKTQQTQQHVNSALAAKTAADQKVSEKMADNVAAQTLRELSQSQVNSAQANAINALNVKRETVAKIWGSPVVQGTANFLHDPVGTVQKYITAKNKQFIRTRGGATGHF
jgi:hypothetical protein